MLTLKFAIGIHSLPHNTLMVSAYEGKSWMPVAPEKKDSFATLATDILALYPALLEQEYHRHPFKRKRVERCYALKAIRDAPSFTPVIVVPFIQFRLDRRGSTQQPGLLAGEDGPSVAAPGRLARRPDRPDFRLDPVHRFREARLVQFTFPDGDNMPARPAAD